MILTSIREFPAYASFDKRSSKQCVYGELLDNPNQARACRSPMRMNNDMMPPMITTLQLGVPNRSGLIDFSDASKACGSKSSLIRLGPPPVSSKLATVIEALDDTPMEISTRYVALRKNDGSGVDHRQTGR